MKKHIIIRAVLFLLLLACFASGTGALFLSRRTPRQLPQQNQISAGFPVLEGTNLLLERVTVPSALEGNWKLLVVAYDSAQQPAVNKWLLPLERLQQHYPQLAGYYLPLLPSSTADAALPILGGMTLAASGDEDRQRTIVVFTDIDAFNSLVGVGGVGDVQLFLLDAQNRILWQGSGDYEYATLAALEAALAAAIAADDP